MRRRGNASGGENGFSSPTSCLAPRKDPGTAPGSQGLSKAAMSHVAACPWQAVKELQTSTREAIVLLKAMIEEVRNSAEEEETAINALFGSMQVSRTRPGPAVAHTAGLAVLPKSSFPFPSS